jgi:hypothetical protein
MCISRFRDYRLSNSWHFQNLWLLGAAMLLITPILRHGTASQRVVAALLGVLPAIFAVGQFYFVYMELTTS